MAMSPSSLTELTASIQRGADALEAGDEDAAHIVLVQVADAADAAAATGEGEPAEALLQCLLQAFSQGGEAAKALLSELSLELLPRLTPLAAAAPEAALLLAELAQLIAVTASPREGFMAVLEALHGLARQFEEPSTLLLLGALVDLLPQLLGRLQRRRSAFLKDCLPAVAAAAQVHGEALQSWAARHQARSAAAATAAAAGGGRSGGESDDAGAELDTTLAQSWRRYLDFAQAAERLVLRQEQDAGAKAEAQSALGAWVLSVLWRLTAMWEPQPAPSTSGGAGASHQQAQQPGPGVGEPAGSGSEAAQVVLAMLQLLPTCGMHSWRQLQACSQGEEVQEDVGAGAGLAAYHSVRLGGPLERPQRPEEVLEVGCHLAMGMAEQASEQQSSALLSKSLALLTLCGHLAASSTTASGTTTAGRSGEQLPLQPQLQQQPQQVEILDPPGDLLASLAPAVGMLCANAALSTSPPHRRAAQDALNGLMRGLPPQLRLGCMRALLQTLQPEAAALLLQLLRREVAVAWPASPSVAPESPFVSAACMQLALAWLQAHGPQGYADADGLAAHANVLCAALNCLRFVLMRESGSGSNYTGLGAREPVAQLVERQLRPLQAAVSTALEQLALAARVQQAGGGGSAANDGGGNNAASAAAGGGGAAAATEAEACGDGQAIDAWLAVSRVQEVLGWVLQQAGEL